MKIICSPSEKFLESRRDFQLGVLMYSQPDDPRLATCGTSIARFFRTKKLDLSIQAWDLLSFALAVIACDLTVPRKNSPDGWTRRIDLEVSVNEPQKWNSQKPIVEKMLSFLSTDIWSVKFIKGGFKQLVQHPRDKFDASCVSLISGGLDSLVGAIDLVADGEKPLFVSQIVRGDRQKQIDFLSSMRAGLDHIQLNHSFRSKQSAEPSQRARSIIFLTYGVVAATLISKYYSKKIPLFVCENGLISINPPLTEARIGSLSTRTTHPRFLSLFQQLVSNLNFNVSIECPYQFSTKGEMLKNCKNQKLLFSLAKTSTSCSRYTRNGLTHCGRCVPCLIRRAAFIEWKRADSTDYVFKNLSLNDPQYANFDDVRSALIALKNIDDFGFSAWFGSVGSTLPAEQRKKLSAVSQRGMRELDHLLKKYKLR